MAQSNMSACWRRRGVVLLMLCGGCLPMWGAAPPPAQGPVGPPGPAAVAAYYGRFNDQQASELAPKLAAALDENKVLMGRLQELQMLLAEKEHVLVLARGEIQMATEEVGRTRQEVEHSRQELTRFSDQMRKSDKEGQAVMREMFGLLDLLLQQLDRPARVARPKAKEPPPAPVAGPSLEAAQKADSQKGD